MGLPAAAAAARFSLRWPAFHGDHDAVQRHRHYDGLLRDFLGETKALLEFGTLSLPALTQLLRQAVERAT